MIQRLDRAHRFFPVVLGAATLAVCALLLIQDGSRWLLPSFRHTTLEAFALTLIAIAYLVYQALHRPPAAELVKATLLALAFVFWAANQVWPKPSQAILFNDLAIGLFVFDVFLVMAGWPPEKVDHGFGEAAAAAEPREGMQPANCDYCGECRKTGQ